MNTCEYKYLTFFGAYVNRSIIKARETFQAEELYRRIKTKEATKL